MRVLPLYPDGPPKPAIMTTPAQPRNSSCNACELHEYQMSGFRCHAGIDVREERQTATTISEQPYLLVLLSRLNDGESAARFETSKQYAYVRRVVTELWPGPFSIDYAVRCPISMPQADDFELSWVDRCAPYTAARLEALRPARVIACGNAALRTILGDTVDSLAAQGGWGWLDQGRPVFYLSDPDRAAWHPGYRGEFDALLRRALTIAADALPPHPAAFQTRALLVDTVEDALEAFQRLMEATTLVYDTETVGQLGNPDFRVLCAAVQDADAADVYVWTQEAFADPDAAHVFDYLMRSEVGKCAQHGKFDMGVLAASRGVEVGGHLHDTQYVRRFLQPERLAGLDAQSVLIGQGGYKREQAASEVDELDRLKARDRALGTKRPKGYYGAYVKGGVKAETLHRYVARDVVATAGLRAQQDRALRASARKWFWDEFIEPANRAVTQVEQWGVHASMAEMKRAVIEYSRLIEENEPRLRGVNPNSHKQVLHYLFGPTSEGCLGLEPTEHKTDGGAPSTKDEALLELYRKYDNSIDFIPALMRGRGLIKLRSTYAEGFQPFLRKDRRFHYSVNLDGTETGRMSARDPACYTLPNPGRIDDNSTPPPPYTSKEAALVRGFFTAPEADDPVWSTGFYRQFSKDDEIVLLQADYSQVELRVAAMLSDDREMKAIFESGEDYHMRTGRIVALCFGVTEAEWASWEELAKTNKNTPGFKDRRKPWRSKAKTYNFALLYRKSAKSLAKDMGITVEEAQGIEDAILGKLNSLRDWMTDTQKRGIREGGVHTYWRGKTARFRPLPDLMIPESDREHRSRRSKALRDVVNTPVQGTASDYCVASMTRLVEWIRREQVPARLTLSVYDSLLFEVPSRYVDVVARKAKAIMETEWETHGVPLVAEFELGRQLSNMKDYPIHAA